MIITIIIQVHYNWNAPNIIDIKGVDIIYAVVIYWTARAM